MPNYLHPVESESEFVEVPVPHPLLKDATAITEVHYPEGAEYPVYSVTFNQAFEAADVVGLLSAPMDGIVPGFSGSDVRQGLRSLTYPNSRIMKRAKALDHEARTRILGQRSEIRDLLDVIDFPNHHEMVPAKVHTLDRDLASIVARAELESMKPRELIKLCASRGISYDEVHIWKQKEGNRTNRTVRLDALKLDSDALIAAFVKGVFRPKTIIPTDEEALVPAADLPKSKWAHDPGYIELLRRLPRLAGEDIDRWSVLLRRDGTPRHVVRPQIAWTTDVTTHHDIIAWKRLRDRFVTGDRLNHATFVHTSSLLGAAMLAAQVSAEERGVFKEQLSALGLHRDHVYAGRPAYPPRLAGTFIALLQSESVTRTIMSTEAFAKLRDFAVKRAFRQKEPTR